MMKSISFLILLISGVLLGQKPTISLRTEVLNTFVPLNDSILISKTEVSFGEYTSYLAHIQRDSSESYYNAQLPDSTALADISKANHYYKAPYFMGYLNHPIYNVFPVVGISYQQAIKFCEWKTAQFHQQNKKKAYQNLVFRLPSPEEWNAALGNQQLYWRKQKKKGLKMKDIPQFDPARKRRKVERIFFNVSDIELFLVNKSVMQREKTLVTEGPQAQPSPTSCEVENELGLQHLIGNVSEMTNVEGQAKGLNYSLDYKVDLRNHVVSYTSAQAWLGVRLVASW